MGLKSKVFGVLATAALSLSMIVGATAAPDSGSVTGSVTVEEGVCGINVSQSNSDFGTFKWIDTEYVRQSGNNVMVISGTIYPGEPDGLCDLTVQTSGLVNGTDSIGSAHFSGSLDGNTWYTLQQFNIDPAPVDAALSGGVTFEDVSPNTGSVQLRLDSVPDTVSPGTYNGTIDFTVANAGQL